MDYVVGNLGGGGDGGLVAQNYTETQWNFSHQKQTIKLHLLTVGTYVLFQVVH